VVPEKPKRKEVQTSLRGGGRGANQHLLACFLKIKNGKQFGKRKKKKVALKMTTLYTRH
jgi:hypothetical protein